MDNDYLGFMREFIRGYLFIGEAFKILQDCLYEGHILFFGVNIW